MNVLHVGCGFATLPEVFNGWNEVRLDIDPSVNPDIVSNMTTLGNIGPFDALYSCHNLEHLYYHEVGQALSEFCRVLNHDGFLLLLTPDLEGLEISDRVLFESEAGPITALDLIYGHRKQIPERPYMAHHTGFTKGILESALKEAGFNVVMVFRGTLHSLFALAFVNEPDAEKKALIGKMFNEAKHDLPDA